MSYRIANVITPLIMRKHYLIPCSISCINLQGGTADSEMTQLAGLWQKHSGFCVRCCVENEGSWGHLGLEDSMTLTSLPFISCMVPAHLLWPRLAADFELLVEYFGPGFLK